MSQPPPRSKVLRAYLHRQQNPYAAEQVADSAELLKLSQLPYATHYYRLGDDEYADPTPESPATASTIAFLSKRDFAHGCKQILVQYIPASEKGRLRAAHRAFIQRNQDRPGEQRHRLLAGLRRYDLSADSGMVRHFNRERDALTESKLAEIERLADTDQ